MNLLSSLWRSGWSRFAGRPTRRPGGARRRPLMEELESRVVLTVLSGTTDPDLIEVGGRRTTRPCST